MRSWWPVAAAAVGGVVVCLPLAFVALRVTAALMYGRFESEAGFLLAGFVIFTLLATPVGLMLWPGGKLRRGFAVGLLLGWAGSGIWVGWAAITEYVSTHGPASVVAFDALTGRRGWTVEFDRANGASSPTVEAGLVFVQTGESYDSTAGILVALDAGTGQRLWDVATESGSCGGAGFGAEPPVVADGVVVVRAADGHIKGIDARAGRELWRTEMSGAPAAAARGVVVIGARTTYTGLEVTTGRQRWTRTIPAAAWGDARPSQRAFVIGAGSVFIIELATKGSFGLAALDADSGQELWRASVGSVDSTVQRYQADGENIIAALEGGPAGGQLRLTGRLPSTGRLLWTTPYLPLGEAGLPRTAIAATGHLVFHASSSGVLTAIDARTGDTSWTAAFPGQGVLFPPRLTADHNAVAVRHADQLSVFDAATGASRWSTQLNSGADPETTPAIGANLILVPRSSARCMPPTGGG